MPAIRYTCYKRVEAVNLVFSLFSFLHVYLRHMCVLNMLWESDCQCCYTSDDKLSSTITDLNKQAMQNIHWTIEYGTSETDRGSERERENWRGKKRRLTITLTSLSSFCASMPMLFLLLCLYYHATPIWILRSLLHITVLICSPLFFRLSRASSLLLYM